ncbi:hypothetical protein [uncultured Aureimonas sp.]|uniref:hypothetical protein n=1 Tax=uncultured Aureimonas sp. TaxID=1604662 RepID=UPI0025F199C2|nr:hypothetical protein [uncultured Aureimonas sp.]
MTEDDNERRRAEIEMLCMRALGAAMPDRLVEYLGVGRRSAERWLSGALSWPEPIVDRLREQADHADAFFEDLAALTRKHKSLGMHENLMRMRLRDFAKELSDAPPEKEPPRRKIDDL